MSTGTWEKLGGVVYIRSRRWENYCRASSRKVHVAYTHPHPLSQCPRPSPRKNSRPTTRSRASTSSSTERVQFQPITPFFAHSGLPLPPPSPVYDATKFLDEVSRASSLMASILQLYDNSTQEAMKFSCTRLVHSNHNVSCSIQSSPFTCL